MKTKFHQRILILPVLVLLMSALVPSVASGQDSFVISETKLTNSETGAAGDEFGSAVAIDGSTLVVGASRADDGARDSGAVYLFRYTDGNDFPQTKLTETILTENGEAQIADRFGNSVDISGDFLVIGAYQDDFNVNVRNSGSAFVARFSYDEATEWTIDEQAKLTAREPLSGGDEFGYSAAISGNTVVVGAHRDDVKDVDNNVMKDAGSVYVFNYDGSAWDKKADLNASDPKEFEKFGSSVAIDGDILAVGAIKGGQGDTQTGAVYVFKYNGSEWEEVAELFPDDPDGDDDKFGYSVAIEGDTIIAGAPYHPAGDNNSGAAYVFRHSAGTWIQEAKLTGSGLSVKARFGNSVAISGNTAVVGAYKNDIFDVDNNVMTEAGSAYVYRFDGYDYWEEKARLIPSDAAAGDEFGCAVAISGDIVVVGAYEDDAVDKPNDDDSGSAYVFTIAPENQPPVAIVGENREVEEGSQVTLDGSDSYDPDGDDLLLLYSWTQIGDQTVTLDDANKADPTFEAPAWSDGNETLTFELVVDDGKADSLPAEVSITVLQSTKNVSEVTSVLGSKNRPWGIDKDMYTFQGTQGERVTVTLRAKLGGKNNGGNRATLKLKDNIVGTRFYKMVCSRLPNKICATLPATGQYHVFVAGQPRFFRGKRFLGEYTVTLEGASGPLEQGAGSSVVPKKSGFSTKPHKRHPIWSWLLSRFRR